MIENDEAGKEVVAAVMGDMSYRIECYPSDGEETEYMRRRNC